MNYRDGSLFYAPTDLSRWLSSPYASWMARYTTENPDNAPPKDAPDAMLSRLAERGLAHEDALEQQFKDQGLTVVNVQSLLTEKNKAETKGNNRSRHRLLVELTRDQLLSGVDVVAQAALERDSFSGYADFLVKVPGQSALGDFHYEVWDTKLARRVKPGMVLQLCCYVDMLQAVQDKQSDDLVIALGNGTNERVPLVDCFSYYTAVKRAFLSEQQSWSAEFEPNPANYGNHGDWSTYAQAKLESSDHLSLVARISQRQITRLINAGIETMSALSHSSGVAVAGINPNQMDWLVRQAALQCASVGKVRPAFHVYKPSPDDQRGLAQLPDASRLDVFFDIEGFPLEGDGLEYLWGCTYLNNRGERKFREWWAHDNRAERVAFEGFIDWVYARWREDQNMHVYHYAPYEISACKRLSSRYGTREEELDNLLRNGVFVDLYAIVTHGLQIGEPRYSIKNVERLYREQRDTDVASGGDSVVVYDLWREAFSRGNESNDWQKSEVLAGIRAYNRDDCDSTLELCQWLRERRGVTVAFEAREVPQDKVLPDVVLTRLALRDRLLLRAQTDDISDQERTLLETLAGILEFHRREDKNAWWRFFERMDPANTSLADDPACLSDCRRTSREPFKPTPKARNLAYEFQFNTEQESRGIACSVSLKGAQPDDNGRYPAASVLLHESDLPTGRIVIQCKQEPPELVSLVPNEVIRVDPIPAAIDAVVAEIEAGRCKRSALLDFLERRPPRISGHEGGAIIRSDDRRLEETIEAVRSLDDSCLVIQGPPGAGKSYTGARIIAALVADGKRVGISSNSHPAINNLLIGAAYSCREQGIEANFACTKRTSDTLDELGIIVTKNADLSSELSSACVIGTTAWGFSREDLANEFDVLVVDEAGQVSVANLVAMSRAARNLVLMGDQRQLGQPTQGVHPSESGLSVLDYRLGDAAAVDPAHGVFLETTYRMHPDVNAVVSRHMYAGKLSTDPSTKNRYLLPVDGTTLIEKAAGITYLPVEHEGNAQDSDEEVAVIQDAVQSLLGRSITRKNGSIETIGIDDMLFVAPYNAQVAKLKQALDKRARVGSVDKFQGQEAPIVFLSLCASDATTSPRGLGFLFNRNRLNVAVSRAETLFVLVGHPRLAATPVATLADLKRVNFVAALVEAGKASDAVGLSPS